MSITQIATALLADTSVTTAKIADANVTTAKIADSNVTTAKIADANVTTVKLADANVTTVKIADANVTPAKLSQPLTQGTAVASTSGVALDYTGIPSWVKRITLMFNGVSTNGTSNIQVQIGSSGGVENSGYASCSNSFNNSPATSTATSGFLLWNVVAATYLFDGIVQLVNVSGNIWVTSGTMINEGGSVVIFGGKKTLAGVLDRVRVTTVNGTDTFDAGSINILYE